MIYIHIYVYISISISISIYLSIYLSIYIQKKLILCIYLYINLVCFGLHMYTIWTWLRGLELVKKIFRLVSAMAVFKRIYWNSELVNHCYDINRVLRRLGCCGLGKNEREKAARGSSISIWWVLGPVCTELRFLVSESRNFLIVLSIRVKYL